MQYDKPLPGGPALHLSVLESHRQKKAAMSSRTPCTGHTPSSPEDTHLHTHNTFSNSLWHLSWRRSFPHSMLTYLTLALLMLLRLPCSSAKPQQYTSNNQDDTYNYYYGPGDSYSNGMVSDWANHDWAKISGRIQQPKCVDIPKNMSLCSEIGYDQMMLPNLLEHDTLKEVTQQSKSWVPLVNINCHPDTRIFLCSLFTPVCLDREIYPCRSLCQTVRAHCEVRMKSHGYSWPEMLYCDKFPVDNDMCIMPIHDKKTADNNNCTACRHPQTHEALIDHYCRADVAMRVTLKDFKVQENGDTELSLRKKRKFYKVDNMEKKEAKSLPIVIQGGASCSCPTINATQEKYLLMGMKVENKIVIIFGMVWKRKDKEFKKGIRAIRKNNCQELFKSVIDMGFNEDSQSKSNKTKGGRKKRRNGKKGGRKGKRRKGKGKGKKGKNGKKGKGRKGRKGRKGKKGDDGSTNRMRKRNKTIPNLEDEMLRKMKESNQN